jgi:hypothetical protein
MMPDPKRKYMKRSVSMSDWRRGEVRRSHAFWVRRSHHSETSVLLAKAAPSWAIIRGQESGLSLDVFLYFRNRGEPA